MKRKLKKLFKSLFFSLLIMFTTGNEDIFYLLKNNLYGNGIHKQNFVTTYQKHKLYDHLKKWLKNMNS